MRRSTVVAVALLLAGCGENSSSTGSTSSGGAAGSVASGGGQGGSGGNPTGGSGGSATGGVGATGGVAGAGGTQLARVWGVTIDAIDPLSDITAALGKHAKKPTTRIVFDEYVAAKDYQAATTSIHGVSNVMGELVDSLYVHLYGPTEYVARTQEYVSLLGPVVDVWEIGNEINGEWVCGENAASCTAAETADVVSKIDGAFDVVKAAGGKTALTLYYNQDCWSSADNEMFAWASKNVPAKLKQGLDYVLVSYYDDECNGLKPNWQDVFGKLATMFPSSKLGIGECGAMDAAKKAAFVHAYYELQLVEPRFIGGGFWWWYRQDMVPATQPLWTELDQIMAASSQ